MKILSFFFLLCVVPGAIAQDYIYDEMSAQRQQTLKRDRSVNLFRDVTFSVGGVFLYALTDGQVNVMYADEIQLKKFKLSNECADTLYVNMMSDMKWNDEEYCDFLDIRIPPHTTCKLLLPRHAHYNVYFRNTFNPTEQDRVIEIDTDRQKRLAISEAQLVEPELLP